MNKKIVVRLSLSLGLVLLLSSCGGTTEKVSEKPKPSNNAIITLGNIGTGLFIPKMDSTFPTVLSGPAVDKFGTQYVNDAFRFSFAFAYRAQQIPQLWEPNTKKNPEYINVATRALGSLGNYFMPELNNNFQSVLPKLVNPTIKKGTEFNEDADFWAKLIVLPWRNPDGTLPNPKSSDTENYVLMHPWVFQTSVGDPITEVDTLEGYGSVLKLRFRYLIQQPFGDGNRVSEIVSSTKNMAFWVTKNTDQITSKDYPWLIITWGTSNTGKIKMDAYNPETMGSITKPSATVEFP